MENERLASVGDPFAVDKLLEQSRQQVKMLGGFAINDQGERRVSIEMTAGWFDRVEMLERICGAHHLSVRPENLALFLDNAEEHLEQVANTVSKQMLTFSFAR